CSSDVSSNTNYIF
nr:immunoglobulin light chain junction region [Macaca mulatta]